VQSELDTSRQEALRLLLALYPAYFSALTMEIPQSSETSAHVAFMSRRNVLKSLL
jgi:hypothetical protein